MKALELWGGVECTVNRIHDSFRSQLAASGHDVRHTDIELLGALGFKRMRYPVLWERVAPERPGECSWAWSDDRLQRLRALQIEPIVGLLHHGSGPRYTDLLDPAFPQLFANFARQVAARYPWVTHYTPINEPLTTARFSGLYGHWHPHARSDSAFARALVNESRATVMGMEAIRDINPDAQLIATDDLGQTFGTPSVQYQVDFDNERRWLGWDLIGGRVDRHHAMYGYLRGAGIAAAELDWLCAHACMPDVVGINHYVTSDRMLHEQWRRFPAATWGGNGRHRYADTEAVRVLDDYVPGFDRSLAQAWARYKKPIALTEVHLAAEPEEQVLWLDHAWKAAQSARLRSEPVLAVTSWALLGSFDWNSLLTRNEGYYEAGAFDVRSGVPLETTLAGYARVLAKSGRSECPSAPLGWWQRDSRITAPPECRRLAVR